MMPRVFAAILAVGGIFWGVLLLPVILSGGGRRAPVLILMLGPGYLATAGYVVRARKTPRFHVRMIIWGFSLIVQGTWLVIGVKESGVSPATFWWGFAFTFFVLALLLEFFVDDDASNLILAGEIEQNERRPQ